MIDSVSINWVAIVLAGVVNMLLGMAWYAPQVFGKTWMKLMNEKGEMKPDPIKLVSMFVIAMLIGLFLTHILVYTHAVDFWGGLLVGIWTGFGLVALPTASGALASNTPWKLWAINAGYWVVSMGIMGGILAAMR